MDMTYKLSEVLKSAQLAQSLSRNGRETILTRHTCSHRVDELEQILETLTSASMSSTEAPKITHT